MNHSLGVYLRLLGAGIRSAMQYRLDFLVEITGAIIQYSAQIINLNVIVNRFQNINGWGLHELAFLYALAVVSNGLSQMIFLAFVDLGETLVKGDFDRYLLRPVNSFLLYMGSQVNAGNFGHIIFATVVFIWAASGAHVSWTLIHILYLVLVVIGGALIQGSAIVFVGTLAFWFQRTGTMFWTVVVPSRELVNYPVSIFPRILQIALTFLVPFAFINYYPAHVFLERSGVLFSPVFAWLTPAVGVLTFSGAYTVWVMGTRNYSGAGS